MIYSKPKTEAEAKKLRRESYELEKRGLITIYKERGYEKEYLSQFLVNSLKEDYETELKEDGLI